MAEEKIQSLGKIPDTLEDIKDNPVYKPLTEFWKQSKLLEKDERIENEDLKNSKNDVDEILKTGIYKDSIIVRKYSDLVRAHEKYILTMTKYNQLADEKILDIKNLVEIYYITKKEHKREILEWKEIVEKLKKELIEIRNKETPVPKKSVTPIIEDNQDYSKVETFEEEFKKQLKSKKEK